ncbi:MAG TPA: hypothetical protein VJ180_08690, partial [Pyrinomonadaceae bacterium]|nr:hypothetical protein [Pyrinomonadaceae bacterium]
QQIRLPGARWPCGIGGDKNNKRARLFGVRATGVNDMKIIRDHWSRPISGTGKKVAGNTNLHRSAFDRLFELRGHPVVIETIEAPPTMFKRIINVIERTMRVPLTAWLNSVKKQSMNEPRSNSRVRRLQSSRWWSGKKP